MRLVLSILTLAAMVMGGPLSKTNGIDSMRNVQITQFSLPQPMIVSFQSQYMGPNQYVGP